MRALRTSWASLVVRTLHPLGSMRAPRCPSRLTTLQVGFGGMCIYTLHEKGIRREYCGVRGAIINTTFALNAPVLYLASVPRRRAENSAFHLPAHHVTSPDTSRGETQNARLKSVQSQNAPSLFSCAKSLRRRISSQIGWLTQNSERAVSQLIRAMVRAMVWTRQRTVPRPV